MFELSLRDLWLSWEVNLRCFCVRLSLLFLVGWFLDLKTVGKKMVKLHVNACQVRKQVTVCWHLVFTRNGCRKLSNYRKMCMNIQAWVNAFVLTPASCPTGVCAHGKSRSGPGVKSRMNSLLCVYGSNVWTLATRLVTVVEVNLRCFCVRLSLLFLVGWFLDLKTVGKKMVKLHVNACQVRKQVTVCWHLVLLEMGVESCRITGKCVWISKPGLMRSCWRRPRVLRVSVRTGNRDLARAWNRG